MPANPAVRSACEAVDAAVRSDPRYAHTSAFLVVLDGEVVHEARYRGPERAETFSVTKSVLATVMGVAARSRALPALDEAVDAWVDAAAGTEMAATPSAGQTWRQLLTMTRGSEVDGPYDLDEVAILPRGWVQRVLEAPRAGRRGIDFRYDNGAAHLVAAALTGVLGEPVDAVAERELFAPLGIRGAQWVRDPEGVASGAGFLQLRPADLAALGQLWLAGGRWGGRQVVDAGHLAAMLSPQSTGGPPEGVRYGLLTWVDEDHVFAGGWAGQHVMVVPAARAVVVVTGDPRFRLGPPARDELPADWRPARDLVLAHVLPVLRAASG